MFVQHTRTHSKSLIFLDPFWDMKNGILWQLEVQYAWNTFNKLAHGFMDEGSFR